MSKSDWITQLNVSVCVKYRRGKKEDRKKNVSIIQCLGSGWIIYVPLAYAREKRHEKLVGVSIPLSFLDAHPFSLSLSVSLFFALLMVCGGETHDQMREREGGSADHRRTESSWIPLAETLLSRKGASSKLT